MEGEVTPLAGGVVPPPVAGVPLESFIESVLLVDAGQRGSVGVVLQSFLSSLGGRVSGDGWLDCARAWPPKPASRKPAVRNPKIVFEGVFMR
jgi:hypothetical protein